MFFEYNILWNYSPYVFTSDLISLRFYSLFFALGLFFVYFKVRKDLSNHVDGATIEEIIFPSIVPDAPIGIRYTCHDGKEARPLPNIDQLLGSLPEFGLGSFVGIKHSRQLDDIAEIILILIRPLVVNTAVVFRVGPLVFQVAHYPAARVHWAVEVTS